MNDTMTVGELKMHVTHYGTLNFVLYEPRDQPGFESDIAKCVGCSPNQTANLLTAFDQLEDDHHFLIERDEVRPYKQERDITPAMIRVTITPA